MLSALARVFFIMAMAFALGGCSSINTWLAPTMADHMPAWAGGLPTGAPPRPGTPEYDEYSKKLEQKVVKPDPQNGAPPQPDAPLEPVH